MESLHKAVGFGMICCCEMGFDSPCLRVRVRVHVRVRVRVRVHVRACV